MSLVGPRPDVQGYMDGPRGREAELLALRPGITGPASLFLRDEERLFLAVDDRQGHYDRVLWPHKVRINLDYLEHWSLRRDIAFLAVTALPGLDRVLKVIPDSAKVASLEQASGPIAWWPRDPHPAATVALVLERPVRVDDALAEVASESGSVQGTGADPRGERRPPLARRAPGDSRNRAARSPGKSGHPVATPKMG